jgi:hypothetical protein
MHASPTTQWCSTWATHFRWQRLSGRPCLAECLMMVPTLRVPQPVWWNASWLCQQWGGAYSNHFS